MRIAYIMNTYPVTSATFIRREINAIEEAGLEVFRFASRPWADKLVDPRDIAEKDKTNYLLVGNVLGLLRDGFQEILTNPIKFLSAAIMTLSLVRGAGGGFVKHFGYLAQAIALKRHVVKKGIDHIHCHYSTNPATIALLTHKLCGVPFSFTAHGPDEFTNHHLYNLATKIAHAKFVAAISNYCRSVLISHSDMSEWDKIEIVHCGLDMSDFEPTDMPDNQTLVCVGRLCPQKAQELIVEAFSAIAEERPNAQLILIGDGESRAAVEKRIADHGLADRIEVAGWQDNATVRKRINDSRAFLLPSFAEGLPVVLMECYALRRPAITSYIAGIPELVDHETGWLVPAGSIDHIAVAIKSVLDTPLAQLEEMASLGRQRVIAQHDVTKEVKKLIARVET